MREKLTLGMILLSTSAMMRLTSPFWMAASALTAVITSPEMRCTSASGASSAASASDGSSGVPATASTAISRENHWRRCMSVDPFVAVAGVLGWATRLRPGLYVTGSGANVSLV